MTPDTTYEKNWKGIPSGFKDEISGETSDGSFKTATNSDKTIVDQEKQDVEADHNNETDPAPVKVPRSQRRGLFGRFIIFAEVEEPHHYPPRTKWFITFVIALAAAAAPLGSNIIFRKSKSLQ
jgi:hypothetical protein